MEEDSKNIPVLIFGGSGTGKSALMDRFIEESYQDPGWLIYDDLQETKTGWRRFIEKSDEMCEVVGMETHPTVSIHSCNSMKTVLEGLQGGIVASILLLFDITNRESFKVIEDWLTIHPRLFQNHYKLLVGTKNDLDKREISVEKATAFAEEHGLMYLDTSAKTGENIVDVLLMATKGIDSTKKLKILKEKTVRDMSQKLNIKSMMSKEEIEQRNPKIGAWERFMTELNFIRNKLKRYGGSLKDGEQPGPVCIELALPPREIIQCRTIMDGPEDSDELHDADEAYLRVDINNVQSRISELRRLIIRKKEDLRATGTTEEGQAITRLLDRSVELPVTNAEEKIKKIRIETNLRGIRDRITTINPDTHLALDELNNQEYEHKMLCHTKRARKALTIAINSLNVAAQNMLTSPYLRNMLDIYDPVLQLKTDMQLIHCEQRAKFPLTAGIVKSEPVKRKRSYHEEA